MDSSPAGASDTSVRNCTAGSWTSSVALMRECPSPSSGSASMTHELKCWPEFFDGIACGDKPFDYVCMGLRLLP